MKKIINILLAITLIIVSAFALVACEEPNDNGGNKGLLLKKYSGEDYYTVYGYVDEGKGITQLDIEEVAGEKTVGRIAKNAFNGNDTLVEIIVPETVTEIEAGAFSKMKKLEKITLPFVGKTAQADSYMYQTGEGANKSVDMERSFAYIFGEEEYAYGEMVKAKYGTETITRYLPSGLEEVTIAPSGEYNIPMYAFSGIGLISKVKLTGNITEIGEHAFEGCRDLKEINIPATVKTIYAYAFNNCEYLTNGLVFDADSTLEIIKEKAFANSKLAQITIPASVKVIGESCFENAELSKVVLPASLEKLSAYAFYKCANLSVLDVSALSKTEKPVLGVSAFEDCDKLVISEEIQNAFAK